MTSRSKLLAGLMIPLSGIAIYMIAQAQVVNQPVPTIMNYQGRLAKADGTLVANGNYRLTFRLWTKLDPGDPAGQKVWEEVQDPVVVRNGVFSVLLGSNSALRDTYFNSQVFLETQIGVDPPLTPRQPIGSVPYSLRSEVSRKALTVNDGAITTPKLATGAVSAQKLANDDAGLAKVTGGRFTVVPSGMEAGNGAFGIGLNESFLHGGFALNRYALQFRSDNGLPGAPVAQLSGWNGIKLFTNDANRFEITKQGSVHSFGRFFVNSRGWPDPYPTIDFAVGDNDTGLNWESDGSLQLMANGQWAASWHPDPLRMNLNGDLLLRNAGDEIRSDGRLHIQSGEHLYLSPFGGTTHVGGGGGSGNLEVHGTLSKSGGTFKIDHPLDPDNKYLYHSFVESPDMMNVYNGVVLCDARGRAVVELPGYFEALNKDYRYQLTCVGGYAPVYVSKEVRGNRFEIAGGKPGLKVSWQVTGVRQDDYANDHRVVPEVEKPASERGKRLYKRRR